jgi:hypothetical protein
MRREGSEEEGEKVESEKCKQGKMEGGGGGEGPPTALALLHPFLLRVLCVKTPGRQLNADLPEYDWLKRVPPHSSTHVLLHESATHQMSTSLSRLPGSCARVPLSLKVMRADDSE